MKTLVLYHSHEGNTAWAANQIAELLHADIEEIQPKEVTLKKTGFMRFLWGGQQVIMKETPEILPLEHDWNSYDTIFIGTPVWAFSFTPPIRTLAKEYPIRGKTIGFFCTHGGGPKNTLKDLKEAFPGNSYFPWLEILSPLQFEKEKALDKIQTWINLTDQSRELQKLL